MRIRRRVAVAAAALLAVLAPTVSAAPAGATPTPVAPATAHDPGSASRGCVAGTPATAPATTRFFHDQEILGPDPLPTDAPVGPLLYGYRRLGGMSEDAFEARYRQGDAWRYPPADGFLTENGRPVKAAVTLRLGDSLDRFGYPGGAYLSPTGTPFAARALPPQNLDTPRNAPLSNYHEYCVTRPFRVDGGPIAPWFGQPGLGLQYKLNGAYLPDAGTALSVTWLLGHGYLVEEDPAA